MFYCKLTNKILPETLEYYKNLVKGRCDLIFENEGDKFRALGYLNLTIELYTGELTQVRFQEYAMKVKALSIGDIRSRFPFDLELEIAKYSQFRQFCFVFVMKKKLENYSLLLTIMVSLSHYSIVLLMFAMFSQTLCMKCSNHLLRIVIDLSSRLSLKDLAASRRYIYGTAKHK